MALTCTTMATSYSISDLAKEFEQPARAMRFYENIGLLQPERAGPGGQIRFYTARDRTRLQLTLRAKRLSMSLFGRTKKRLWPCWARPKSLDDEPATGSTFTHVSIAPHPSPL